MSYPILYATDIHGDDNVYEHLLDEAIKKKAKAIIIGGDLAPLVALYAINGIEIQRAFFEAYLIPLFENFRKIHNIEIFLIMGNDDYSINMDLLEKAEKNRTIKILNEKPVKKDKWELVGYPYINPSDYLIFPIQDWVKKEGELLKDLEKTAKNINMKNVIYVVHAPPKDTNLDILYDGNHVGSQAVGKFIEKHQPYLVLAGHIHESPMISGKITDKIGHTICIQPGNAKVTLIDLEEPEKAKKI